MSARVAELLEASELRGWTTYPVIVFDKNNTERTGYMGLSVVGRCGTIDLSRSSIKLKKYPAGHFPEFQGHFFDPESWDGSDFVVPIPDAVGHTSLERIVTQRVVELFKRHKVNNLRWICLSAATFSTSVYEIGFEHLLPGDFWNRVAHAYREAGVTPPEQYR